MCCAGFGTYVAMVSFMPHRILPAGKIRPARRARGSGGRVIERSGARRRAFFVGCVSLPSSADGEGEAPAEPRSREPRMGHGANTDGSLRNPCPSAFPSWRLPPRTMKFSSGPGQRNIEPRKARVPASSAATAGSAFQPSTHQSGSWKRSLPAMPRVESSTGTKIRKDLKAAAWDS